MKLGELIQRVQSLYSKGVESYDARLTPVHIYSKIKSARAAYLQTQQNSIRQFEQATCVRLQTASQCCNVPVNTQVVYADIPDMLYVSGVYMLNGTSLVRAEQHQIEYIDTNLTSKPLYYISGNKLILVGKQMLRYVKLVGVPIDVVDFYSYCRRTAGLCNVSCNKCKSAYDIDIPIDGNMVEYVIQYAVNELIRLFSVTIEDKQQDASDDTSLRQAAAQQQTSKQ